MARFNIPIAHVAKSDFSGAGAGWLLNFYLTNTTDRKDTFSDSALSSANANPVIADSSGRFGDIFLESGTYKVVLTDADAVEIWTADPVVGSLGTSGAFTSNKTTAYTVTIDDATKVIPVDTATTGAVTITLPAVATATSGFEVTIFKINAGANDVTIDADGSETIGGLANLLLTFQWESVTIRANDNPATDDWTIIARYQPPGKGTDIASATTTDIASADGKRVDITGAVTITGFGTAESGAERILQFDSNPLLTHNASSLILPGGANIFATIGDRAKFRSLGSGNWECLWYQRAQTQPGLPRSYLAGLTLSRDSGDTDHDVNILPGECRDSTNKHDIVLTSEITKMLGPTGAGWVVGDNNGGLDGSESSAGTPDDSTTYHVHLIRRNDTGVVDVLLSESATAPALPTGYDVFRRIGAVITNGSANIIAFRQDGDWFQWDVPFDEVSNGTVASTGGTTLTLAQIPTGVKVRAVVNVSNGTNSSAIYLYDPDVTGVQPGGTAPPIGHTGQGANEIHAQATVMTNTSAQIIGKSSGTATDSSLTVTGWVDTRGRDD